LAVYLVGGLFYQRTVMHARGWRQLPNYSLWAGIGGFIQVCSRVVRRWLCFFRCGAQYMAWCDAGIGMLT
jgi:hypothetical protein